MEVPFLVRHRQVGAFLQCVCCRTVRLRLFKILGET